MNDYPENQVGGSELEWILARLATNEMEMRLVALDIETSRDIEALIGLEPWKALMSKLSLIVDSEVEKMIVSPMSPADLARRQGYIRALRVLLNKKPGTQEHIAQLRQKAKMLQDQIDDDRRLLQ